jgi:hypothetical protein
MATKKKNGKKAAGAADTDLPPPISGIAKGVVGQVVQRFIDWDEVRELQVAADDDQGTTYTVSPMA